MSFLSGYKTRIVHLEYSEKFNDGNFFFDNHINGYRIILFISFEFLKMRNSFSGSMISIETDI